MKSLINSNKKAIDVSQINKLAETAQILCVVESAYIIPSKIALALYEDTIKNSLSYSLAKKALAQKKESKKKCSDYIDPIIFACPNLLKIIIKKRF